MEQDMARAATLVILGAPLQVLESETKLTRQHLLRLYRRIHKNALPAEMPAIPADWFMSWQRNTHASVFLNVYQCLADAGELHGQGALACSYQLYMDQLKVLDLPQVLSLAHAWRLVKYVDSGELMLKPCARCRASFVVYTLDLHQHFVCMLCQTPSRAGNGADASACAAAEHLN
jgi:flagellar transcriptional activator FlhC